jgi:cytochrome c-type biogenesis protein CcmH/NrfG
MRSRKATQFLALVLAWAGLCVAAWAAGEQSPSERQTKRELCRSLLRESLQAFEAGKADSALVHLRGVLECDPNNPDAFYHTARVFISKADTSGAMTALSEGVQKAPLSSRLKLFLARLEIARGGLEDAAQLVNKVLAIKPDEGEAHYLFGLIHLERGDTTQALDTWQKALEVSDGGGRR